MKSVLDSSFRYTPSTETDVRRTFERIRREQQAETHEGQQTQLPGAAAVTKLIVRAAPRSPR
jgi:hypothetical protein